MQKQTMFNLTIRPCMECLGLCFKRYLFLVVSFILLSPLEGQAQYPIRTDGNYYVYGKSTPVLNDVGEIATYYNTTIEYILNYNHDNYNEDFRHKKFTFEDTLSNLADPFYKRNDWIFRSDPPNAHTFLRKLLRYEYAHLFPLEEGDTLWLPLGSVNPIDRTEHFEAFDELFEKKETELIRDSLLGNYIDFALLDELSGFIPYKLWECVADTIQENAFIGGLTSFKFAFNDEMTAYLIKVEYEKPYSAYLYLIRNSDKKLIGEKPILVYFRQEAGSCQYRTDTKITDYNKDGHLDLIIYQKEDCGGIGSSSKYTYRILLWEEDKSDFLLRYESKKEDKNNGWIDIQDRSTLEKVFGEIDYQTY